jgi:hypothetical protein
MGTDGTFAGFFHHKRAGHASQTSNRPPAIMTIDLLQRRGVPVLIAQKAMTQEKSPSPGLGFVKLDFLIGTKWGSNAGRTSQSPNRRRKRP